MKPNKRVCVWGGGGGGGYFDLNGNWTRKKVGFFCFVENVRKKKKIQKDTTAYLVQFTRQEIKEE